MASSSSSQNLNEQGQGRKRDWFGGLPTDLTGEIMSRFSSSGDHVRFGAVSTSWRRSAAAAVRRPRPRPSHPPWLMLPGAKGEEDDHRTLYSLSEKKLYCIHLPQIQGQRCVGSGNGWIITVNNLTGDLQLLFLDPLTAGSTTFPLPPVTTFSDVADTGVFDLNGRQLTGYMCRESRPFGPTVFPERLRHYFVPPEPPKFKFWALERMHSFYKKAVFFPSASLVFVIYNTPERLAFARLGDESWNEFDMDCTCIRDVASRLELRPSSQLHQGDDDIEVEPVETDCWPFNDVVFHKGQFYVTVPPGWIMALDLSSTPPRCTCVLLRPPPISYIDGEEKYVESYYLVESPDGEELMQVWRHAELDNLFLTNDFTIFKCKLNSDDGLEAKWVEVKCLDLWVLFLGDNLSLALSAIDLPELTPNSIYFAYSEVCEFWSHNPTEMGVFHMESGTIESLPFSDDESLLTSMNWPFPVWIPHTESLLVVTQFAKGYNGDASATFLSSNVDNESKKLVQPTLQKRLQTMPERRNNKNKYVGWKQWQTKD